MNKVYKLFNDGSLQKSSYISLRMYELKHLFGSPSLCSGESENILF